MAERGGYLRALVSDAGARRPATADAASSRAAARAPHRPAWGPAIGALSAGADDQGESGAPADGTAIPTTGHGAAAARPAPPRSGRAAPAAPRDTLPPGSRQIPVVPRPGDGFLTPVRPGGPDGPENGENPERGRSGESRPPEAVRSGGSPRPAHPAVPRTADPEAPEVRSARRPRRDSTELSAEYDDPRDTRRAGAIRARTPELQHLIPREVPTPSTVRVVLPERLPIPVAPVPQPAAPAVHIGVLEVRVESPRPVVPAPPHQPPAPAVAPSRPAPGRLSRPAPHFGLVQG